MTTNKHVILESRRICDGCMPETGQVFSSFTAAGDYARERFCLTVAQETELRHEGELQLPTRILLLYECTCGYPEFHNYGEDL